jgi:Cu-Zn family superoxide dismutase
LIRAWLRNLPQGLHGVHIHDTGACSPDFDAAGGHYAPAGPGHGFQNARGFHAGDLPNIHVHDDGTATVDVFAPRLTLRDYPEVDAPDPLDDGDGAALRVHAVGDDYRSEGAGSTGDRLACGVIAADGA